MLMSVNYALAMQVLSYRREVYNILDFFGDIGGVTEIFILFVGIIMLPAQRHIYIL
jgi:hypothetical protein